MTDDSTLDQSQDQPVVPNPALRALDVLVGTWQISGRESGPEGEIHGQSRYEWMEGGFYLVQHVDMDHVGHHIKGIEYIGHDPAADNLRSYYFGTEAPGPFGGVALEYVYEVTDETLTIWGGEVGSPAAYKGRFVNGRDTVAGAWEWPGGGYEATMTRVG
ncbi:MAG: hypothetical protein WKH47_09200 [Actinomycetes bacterium]